MANEVGGPFGWETSRAGLSYLLTDNRVTKDNGLGVIGTTHRMELAQALTKMLNVSLSQGIDLDYNAITLIKLPDSPQPDIQPYLPGDEK